VLLDAGSIPAGSTNITTISNRHHAGSWWFCLSVLSDCMDLPSWRCRIPDGYPPPDLAEWTISWTV